MDSILSELQQVIEDGFSPHHPYWGNSVGVFRSHYDWHSSVHAHWALLAMARLSGHSKLLQKTLERLTPQALAQAQEELNENPEFELPYGQSWLLLLLEELNLHEKPPSNSLKLETEQRVIRWLENSPFPDGVGGTSHGAHSSWLFSYFLLSRCRLNPQLKRTHQKYRAVQPICDEDDRQAFASSVALSEVLDGRCERKGDGLIREIQSFPAVTRENGHQVGRILTDLWPLAGSTSTKGEFDRGLQCLVDRPELWKTDFVSVAHWVPQFMWMGLWLGREGRY